MNPTFVQIGSEYVNLSQIAFADFAEELTPEPQPFVPDPNFNPFSSSYSNPEPRPARLNITFSGGARQQFTGEAALVLKSRLEAFLAT